jgi:hypothetical protein
MYSKVPKNFDELVNLLNINEDDIFHQGGWAPDQFYMKHETLGVILVHKEYESDPVRIYTLNDDKKWSIEELFLELEKTKKLPIILKKK